MVFNILSTPKFTETVKLRGNRVLCNILTSSEAIYIILISKYRFLPSDANGQRPSVLCLYIMVQWRSIITQTFIWFNDDPFLCKSLLTQAKLPSGCIYTYYTWEEGICLRTQSEHWWLLFGFLAWSRSSGRGYGIILAVLLAVLFCSSCSTADIL